MKRWLAVLVLLAVVAAGLYGWREGVPWPGTASLSEEDSAIYEAVFRYQREHDESGARYYFLSIRGQNPPADFLARFADKPPVVKYSRTRFGIRDGVLLWADEIRHLGSDRVEVDTGWYDRSGGWRTFRQVRADGSWVVEWITEVSPDVMS
jgi:hypothetical protein